MFKARLTLLGALAVLAVSAAAAATASGAECKKEANKKFVLCIGEPPILTIGGFKFKVRGTTEFLLKTANVVIQCKEVLPTKGATITGEAGAVKINKLVLEFAKCQVTKPANCTIENESFKTLSLEGGVTVKRTMLVFSEEAGNHHIATITFMGIKCIIAGKENLVSQKNNHEEGPLFEALSLEVTGKEEKLELPGTEATSSLKLGEEIATLKGNSIAEVLDEKEVALKWSVVEGK